MSSIFSPKMPSLPPVQPLPEPPKSEVSAEEKERIAKEQAKENQRQKKKLEEKRTYTKLKDHGTDISFENEVKKPIAKETKETKSSLTFGD